MLLSHCVWIGRRCLIIETVYQSQLVQEKNLLGSIHMLFFDKYKSVYRKHYRLNSKYIRVSSIILIYQNHWILGMCLIILFLVTNHLMLTLFGRLFLLCFTKKGNNWKKRQNKKKELGPRMKNEARHGVDVLHLKDFEKIDKTIGRITSLYYFKRPTVKILRKFPSLMNGTSL